MAAAGLRYPRLPNASRYIRLLEVHPWNLTYGPLRSSLHMFRWIDYEPYRALSYAWGDTSQDSGTSIVCDGQDILIPANLHRALRHLRRATESVFLWVDFLCINQNDIEERNQQVRNMAGIYRRSTDVVIWLGEVENAKAPWIPSDGPDAAEIPVDQWYGDDRDQGLVDRYLGSLESYRRRPELRPPPDYVDTFGALCLLSLLSRGVSIDDIPFYSGPMQRVAFFSDLLDPSRIRNGLWAIMDSPWVST